MLFLNLLYFEMRRILGNKNFTIGLILLVFIVYGASVESIKSTGGQSLFNINYLMFFTFICSMLVHYISGMSLAKIMAEEFHHRLHETIAAMNIPKLPYFASKMIAFYLKIFISNLAISSALILSVFSTSSDYPVSIVIINITLIFVVMTIPETFFNGVLIYVGTFFVRKAWFSSVVIFINVVLSINIYMMADSKKFKYLDIYGLSALKEQIWNWNSFDLMNKIVPISHQMLLQKVLIIALALILFCILIDCFDIDKVKTMSKKSQESRREKEISIFKPKSLSLDKNVHWYQLQFRVLFEVKNFMKGTVFWVNVFLITIVLYFKFSEESTKLIESLAPHSMLVAESIVNQFSFFLLIILYTVTLSSLLKEREIRVAELIGSMPMRRWNFLCAKVLGLFINMIVLHFVVLGIGVVVQIYLGEKNVNIIDYIKILGLYSLIPSFFIVVLQTFFIFGLNKNLFLLYSIFSLVLTITAPSFLKSIQWIFPMFLPKPEFSMLNGLHANFSAYLWSFLGCCLLSMILVFMTSGLWSMCEDLSFKQRFKLFAKRLSSAQRLLLISAAILMLCHYLFVGYQTLMVNPLYTNSQAKELKKEYAEKYSQFEKMPSLTITHINTKVDIHPKRGQAEASGYYLLKNNTTLPISTINIHWNSDYLEIELPSSKMQIDDKDFRLRQYQLTTAVDPGASIKMMYRSQIRPKGIDFYGRVPVVYENGTFFNALQILPQLNINEHMLEEQKESSENEHEVSHGKDIKNLEHANPNKNFINSGADFITYEAIVSTEKGQMAFTSGDLIKTEIKDDRHISYFKSDVPMIPYFAFLSGNWQSKKLSVKDKEIEIFFDPQHEKYAQNYLLEAELSLLKMLIFYGSYPHKQLRIFEIPKYFRYCQSFPGMITVSEYLFLLREDDLDRGRDTITHEIIHQWWGNQILTQQARGMNVVIEGITEYITKFGFEIRNEKFPTDYWDGIDLLRSYLRGRKDDLKGEVALVDAKYELNLNYRKVPLVLRSISAAIGKRELLLILREYFDKYKYKSSPYPNLEDLINLLQRSLPEDKHYLLRDLFYQVTLHDFKISNLNLIGKEGSLYKYAVDIEMLKYHYDIDGREIQVDFKDKLTIGLIEDIGNKEEKIEIMEFSLNNEKTKKRLEFSSTKVYPWIFIDPYGQYLDKNPNDNYDKVDSL